MTAQEEATTQLRGDFEQFERSRADSKKHQKEARKEVRIEISILTNQKEKNKKGSFLHLNFLFK